MIPIKRGHEIESMRKAGETAAAILEALADMVAPGCTTGEIDRAAARLMAEAGVRSAFLGYKKFPGHICISINEEVVHGIGGGRRIQYGDLVKMDVGIIRNGWIGDTAASVPAGILDPETERLSSATEEILAGAIQQARAGNRVGDICAYIGGEAHRRGFGVVRDFVGHGVGRRLHEDPQIPNFGRPGTGALLKPGMTLAIEPMINQGGAKVRLLPDKWTVVTEDGLPSAHFEHTVLVTEDEPEILTCSKKLVFT